MPTLASDPFRAERVLLWRNRIERWRANPGETAFHALALLALAALLAWPLPDLLLRIDPGAHVRTALARWPVAMAAALFVVLLLRQSGVLARERDLARRHWLALQPIPPHALRRRRTRLQWREAALQCIVVAGGLVAADAGIRAIGVAAIAAVAAWLLAPRLPQRDASAPAVARRVRSALRSPGAGRLWRWQWIDTGIALRARSLAGGALILLLVPMGSRPVAIAITFACGLGVAALLTAWRRSVAVLPAAQAWLGVLPLRATQLLRGTLGVPLLVLATAAMLLLPGFTALGALRFGVLLAAGVVATATLHLACVAAQRRQPRRIALVFALHAVLLLGVLQAVPPLAPIAWLAQLAWLWRTAVRA